MIAIENAYKQMAQPKYMYGGYEMGTITLSELLLKGYNGKIVQCVDNEKVIRYSKLRTKAPIILLTAFWQIKDGHHRVAAAIVRGDVEIEYMREFI